VLHRICRPGAMLTSDCGPGNQALIVDFNRHREKGSQQPSELDPLKMTTISYCFSPMFSPKV
jgi:hypothetical protein